MAWNCNACGSNEFIEVLNLGKTPRAHGFVKVGSKAIEHFYIKSFSPVCPMAPFNKRIRVRFS